MLDIERFGRQGQLLDDKDRADEGGRTANEGDGGGGCRSFFLDDGRAAGESGCDGAQDDNTGIGGGEQAV
jgi:hypothetical protein